MTTPAAEALTGGQAAQGLTEAEAAARRARGEGNVVATTTRSYTRILVENLVTPVNVVLFAIAITLVVLGAPGDAFVTGGLVLINVVVGVFQEARAKRQLDRIALLTRPRAVVVRVGQEKNVDPNEIVRGDLLVVRPGDQILVDGTVTSGEMHADESLLTGESDLIAKRPGDDVYSGSFCVTGSAFYEAEKVGGTGFAQQITAGAREFRQVKTPLQREVGLIIQVTAVLVLALGVQVARSVRAAGDVSLLDAVRQAAVIVALVPQGLLFMVTVTYAMAAVRMTGKGALIQRMNAVESTSHVDVLCMDKTGTLTTNQLALETVQPFGVEETMLRRLLGDFAASTAAPNKTTAAIAAACGGEQRPVHEEAAFSSERKWSALAFDGQEPHGVFVLGAPEMLQPALRAGAIDAQIEQQVREQAARGLRVLLFAKRDDLVPLLDEAAEPRLPPDLEPIGLMVFSDELRPEAGETIRQFGEAGIALKVISGDNPETVAALARQAGIDPEARAISGIELKEMDAAAFEQAAMENTVFGRITPQQKKDLVDAFKRRGHYVAMTGDGVNDVLALKEAQVAVAMRSGSQMTRSVADIVLIDDSFAALPAAFREGQRVLRGMQDIIRLFLARTLSVALVILGSTLLGEAFPVTPKQNTIPALLTVGIPTFALAVWARPGATPRRLLPSASHFVLPAAVTIAGVALVVYSFYTSTTDDVALARTALTTTVVLCGLVLIPFVQPPSPAWVGGAPLNGDWRPTALAAAMLALFVTILAVGPLRRFTEMDTLSAAGYAMIALAVLGWAVGLRFIWRLHLAHRLGGLLARVRRQREAPSPDHQP